jgi:hypothetical protein
MSPTRKKKPGSKPAPKKKPKPKAKARAKAKPKSKPKRKPPTTTEGVEKLRKDQLLRWLLLRSEVGRCRAVLDRRLLQLQHILELDPKVRAAQARCQTAQEELDDKARQLKEYIEPLLENRGYGGMDVVIDDETGAIEATDATKPARKRDD